MSLLSNLRKRAKQLKSKAQVLMIAYKDRRTPASAKILIGLTAGYLFKSKIALYIKLIPATVLKDAREQLKNNPQRYRKNNRLFAIIIIIVWLSVLYLVFVWVKRL